MAGYAGAWKRATQQPVTAAPLVPGLDPEHYHPHNEQDLNYTDTTGAPGLPAHVVGGQYQQDPNVPVRYLDRDPHDPEFGVGDLPGVSQAQAREIGNEVRELDFGTVAAQAYEAAGSREGTYQVQRVVNTPLDGASPVTVDIRYNTGVGSPYDLDARRNTRITRWRDRFIDMHWFGVEWRSLPNTYAQTAPELPYVPNRTTPTVSPYRGNLVEDPQNWQTPQERRGPREWDESMTTDGTDQPLAASAFGLTTWGL